ncbi:hypothetical protein ABEW05_004398 [Botrytis cinerea]
MDVQDATNSTNGPVGTHNSDLSVHCSKPRCAIHATTVRSLPGENAWTPAAYKVCCLLVPYAGVGRGLNVFLRASTLAKTPLQIAARANVLCMVVLSQSWGPGDGDFIHVCALDAAIPDNDCQNSCGLIFLDKSKTIEHVKMADLHACASEVYSDISHIANALEVILNVRAMYAHYASKSKWAHLEFSMLQSYRFRAISWDQQLICVGDIQLHGLCQLPPGYTLCLVQPHMAVNPRYNTLGLRSSIAISSQFSALQVLWSIAHACIGSYTLYQSKGSQLDIYGYAALGLTVIPYVIASIINLLASLVIVDGVIGSIDRAEDENENITSDDN